MKYLSDEYLMLKVKTGNINYMTEIYNRYNNSIFNYFYRLTEDYENSKDLTQTLFLRLIKYRKSYSRKGVFKYWLYRIAQNLFRNYSKARKKLSKYHYYHEQDLVILAPEEDMKEDKDKLLFQALSKLPVEYKELIVLSKFQSMKYKEIAHLFATTEASIKNKIYRALDKLRSIYFIIQNEQAL